MRNSPYYALRRVTLEIHGETIQLRGQVSSYFLKQMAQTVVLETAPQTAQIENRLEVIA